MPLSLSVLDSAALPSALAPSPVCPWILWLQVDSTAAFAKLLSVPYFTYPRLMASYSPSGAQPGVMRKIQIPPLLSMPHSYPDT